jgi:RecB family endonuclease NucS
MNLFQVKEEINFRENIMDNPETLEHWLYKTQNEDKQNKNHHPEI